MINTLFSNPLLFAAYLFALVAALTVHEFSHALVADRLGDPTPRLAGRLSLNPLVHFDLVGSLFLLFFGFGWGKPVPIDQFNLKKPRQDSAIVSVAGPLSNLLLALMCAIILRLFILFKLPVLSTIGLLILYPFIILNVTLGIFNLLPIHPLDGFKIVGGLLNERKAEEWYGLQRYGFIFLLLMIMPFGSQSLVDSLIRPVMSFLIGILLPSGGLGGII